MRQLLATVLLLGALGLAALTVSQFRRPLQEDEAAAPGARAVPAGPEEATRASGTDRAAAVATILARPLFSPQRRPRQPGAAPAPAAAAAPKLPRMAAILIDGSQRHAIFDGGNGKPLIVDEGGEIAGFTVKSIEPQQVTVIGPDGPRVVRTSFAPGATAAATTPGGLPLPEVNAPGQPQQQIPPLLPSMPAPPGPPNMGRTR